ncbi:hypothetical protein PR048_026614 [Dryococelus australis]|uniref:Uncharacterized protein n=1 Tax=Dryococelus australis TaxID=614101 RepID=A0ABQ9GLV0_9NEOP|nr:hypothetical protein PR048_026614 [Dryococelus australis]
MNKSKQHTGKSVGFLGILRDNEQWDATMEEAMLCRSPAKLRELFAILISTCGLSYPLQLWDNYKEALPEDIFHMFQGTHQANNNVFSMKKKFADFRMPASQHIGELSSVVIRELDDTAASEFKLTKWNTIYYSSRETFHKILRHIENGEGGL